MPILAIVGCCDDKELYHCQILAQRLVEVYATAYDLVLIIQFEALLEIDYIRRLEKEKTLLGGALYSHSASHYVLLDNTYLGDVESVKQRLLDCGAKLIEPDIVDNMQSANRETARCLGRGCTAFLAFSSHNPLDKTTERPYYKKLTIQLFTDICPLACENFMKLCTGEVGVLTNTKTKLHYLNCPIHRIVPGGWLQCGDIVDGSGSNSVAAIGDANHKIRDENLSVDFSEKLGGVVGFSKSAVHSNGSQFFITLGACPWMNNKFVGIGRVVRGFKTLKQISMEDTKNQKPVKNIFISSCGKESNFLQDFE